MIFREVTDGDLGLVYNSWLRSFRPSNGAGPVRACDYWDVYTRQIDELRTRPGFRWAVADMLGDGRHIAGWIAWLEPGRHAHRDPESKQSLICGAPALLYVYVKDNFRRARSKGQAASGIGTQLLKHAGIDPAAPWCFAFWTPQIRIMLAGLRDKAGVRTVEPAWPGGRLDTMFVRER